MSIDRPQNWRREDPADIFLKRIAVGRLRGIRSPGALRDANRAQARLNEMRETSEQSSNS